MIDILYLIKEEGMCSPMVALIGIKILTYFAVFSIILFTLKMLILVLRKIIRKDEEGIVEGFIEKMIFVILDIWKVLFKIFLLIFVIIFLFLLVFYIGSMALLMLPVIVSFLLLLF